MSTSFSPPEPMPGGVVTSSESRVLPLIEESVAIETRRIDQGGYRISKRVSVKDEVVDTPLTSQEVNVERRLIGQLLTSMEAPIPRQEGDTWIIPVVEEVLVTEKRLMLREEIWITRTSRVHREAQHVSLRSEEISIERLAPGNSPDLASP